MTTACKERPILFSAPMVRALLAGTKTQTRRIAKVPADATDVRYWAPPSGRSQPGWADPGLNYWTPDTGRPTQSNHLDACPYGQPGDRLWVRETWMDLQGTGIEATTGSSARCAYRADTPPGSYGDEARKAYGLKWTPAIHMFRWASRILLEVTDVRVERLQDISEADAIAEGLTAQPCGGWGLPAGEHFHSNDPRMSYWSLWESINGAGSVEANPWVWAVSFKQVQAGKEATP